MDEVRGPEAADEAEKPAKSEKPDCNETRRHRMERFALKRKFASLSSRLDRAHREARFVFMCVQHLVCLDLERYTCLLLETKQRAVGPSDCH